MIAAVCPCLIDANFSVRLTLQHIGYRPCRVYVEFAFPAARLPSYGGSGPPKQMVLTERSMRELSKLGSAALISIESETLLEICMGV